MRGRNIIGLHLRTFNGNVSQSSFGLTTCMLSFLRVLIDAEEGFFIEILSNT